LRAYKKDFQLKWVDVRNGIWIKAKMIDGGKIVKIATPADREWVCVISSK